MSDRLWELFQRVVPPAPTRPQGRGRRRVDDRSVLAAVVFMATCCTWRRLPSTFDASWQTGAPPFTEWTAARVGAKLHPVLLDELGVAGELDWSRCAIDSVSVRAANGGN